MKRTLLVTVLMATVMGTAYAQNGYGHIQAGVGMLYERGYDLTLAYEHEGRHHNAWEYFVNGYIKWDVCPSCGHICPESFWHNYRTWSVGSAWKPCVIRTRNTCGRLRLGASAGSDTHQFVGIFHAGYEHDYTLHGGVRLFWQVGTELTLNAEDLLRTGAVIGIKLPVNR